MTGVNAHTCSNTYLQKTRVSTQGMHAFFQHKIVQFSIVGAIVGIIYGNIEFLIDSQTDDVEPYWPLQVRATAIGIMVGAFSSAIEKRLKEYFKQRQFIFLVLARAIIYTLLITICLTIVNGIWFGVNNNEYSTLEEMDNYFTDRMYAINVITIFIVVIISGSIDQINSLHSRGELMRFITGRFHTPHKVERIFCFIDLKRSTSITEELGNLRYANFLRDYYSDISDAIRVTKAEIYQFVGDEIVLCWDLKTGSHKGNCIRCVLLAQKAIEQRNKRYLDTYGHTPQFRAGLHTGECIVTWVGEVRREIVYIGDVLNTAARIQEQCKVHEKDILVSEDLLNLIDSKQVFHTTFVDEIIPRGKERSIKIWSVESE